MTLTAGLPIKHHRAHSGKLLGKAIGMCGELDMLPTTNYKQLSFDSLGHRGSDPSACIPSR